MVVYKSISDLASKSSIDKFKEMELSNPKNILFPNLNINFIRNKLENLCGRLVDKVDILTFPETKLDGSFPTNRFLIQGFHQLFWLDINMNSGGLLIYIKSVLSANILLNHTLPSDIQTIPFELNLKKI